MNKESQKNKNWWENYFAKDGGWERNGGRDQTFLFAKKFTELIKIESKENFLIMDAGCALGGALRLFSEVYPLASIFPKMRLRFVKKNMVNLLFSLLAISETLKVFMI